MSTPAPATPPPPRSAGPLGPPGPRVVALGGGHGLAASLAALRRVTEDLTAIVTVADDGGSSGRLRRDFDCLPPGDLRQALAALCDDDEWGRTWAMVLQHRFVDGGTAERSDLAGHAVGNLLILALWELLADPVAGLDWVGRLLGAKGRVLPMAAVPLVIAARVRGHDPAAPDAVSEVRGQVAVATTPGDVLGVALLPADPPARPEALAAVGAADALVFGPGSWFTSVLPHVMVPRLAAAIRDASARRVVTLNLVAQPGETDGYSPERHLQVLAAHAPWLRLDAVLADTAAVTDRAALELASRALGAELVVTPLARADAPARHDPKLLAAAYASVLGRSIIGESVVN